MIRCTKCGTVNGADATFCATCNSYLEWSGEPVEDGVADSQAPMEREVPATAEDAAAAPASGSTTITLETGTSSSGPAPSDAMDGPTTRAAPAQPTSSLPSPPVQGARDRLPRDSGRPASPASRSTSVAASGAGVPEPAKPAPAGRGSGGGPGASMAAAAAPAAASGAPAASGGPAPSASLATSATTPAAAPTPVSTPGSASAPRRPGSTTSTTATDSSTPPARKPGTSLGPPARKPSAAAGQPASRKPTKVVQAPKPKPKAVAPKKEDLPKPGDLICPSCGTGNDRDRRFCRRCGTSLLEAPIATAAPERVPWYRRLLGRRPAQSVTYVAGQRPADARGLRHWRPGAGLTLAGVLVAFGLGGVLSYLYVPEVRGAADGLGGAVDCRLSEFTRGTTLYPFTSEARGLRGHRAEHATDLVDETYWLGPRGGNGRASYRIRFDRNVDVQRLNVYSGSPDEGGRPRRIRLEAGSAAVEPGALMDSSDLQSVEACLRGVDGMTIVILDAYPADARDVAIRRLEVVALK